MDQFRDLARGGTAPHISRSDMHNGDSSPVGGGWYTDMEWGVESYSRPSLSRGSNQLAELNNALRHDLAVQSVTPTAGMYASAGSFPDDAPWHVGDGDLSPRSSPIPNRDGMVTPSSPHWGTGPSSTHKRPPTSTRSPHNSGGFRGGDPGSPHLFTSRGNSRENQRGGTDSPRRGGARSATGMDQDPYDMGSGGGGSRQRYTTTAHLFVGFCCLPEVNFLLIRNRKQHIF